MRLARVGWSRKLQICQPISCLLYFGPTTYASTSTKYQVFLPPQVPTPNSLNASACSLRKYRTHLHKEAKDQVWQSREDACTATCKHNKRTKTAKATKPFCTHHIPIRAVILLWSHMCHSALGCSVAGASSILEFGSTKHLHNIHIIHWPLGIDQPPSQHCRWDT